MGCRVTPVLQSGIHGEIVQELACARDYRVIIGRQSVLTDVTNVEPFLHHLTGHDPAFLQGVTIPFIHGRSRTFYSKPSSMPATPNKPPRFCEGSLMRQKAAGAIPSHVHLVATIAWMMSTPMAASYFLQTGLARAWKSRMSSTSLKIMPLALSRATAAWVNPDQIARW